MNAAAAVFVFCFLDLIKADDSCQTDIRVNETKTQLKYSGKYSSLIGQALRDIAVQNVQILAECQTAENPDLCTATLLLRNTRRCSDTVYDVVQVGAHAGDSGFGGKRVDRIFEWLRYRSSPQTRAILIEPMRDAFERLTANYRGSQAQIFYVNAAMTVEEKLLQLHTPLACDSIYASSDLARLDWQPGLSAPCIHDVDAGIWTATDIEHVRAHLSPGSEVANTLVLEHHVPALTWKTLLSTYQITDIGLLMLDVEGKDCILLNSFPFHVLKPQVIEFEHLHCDGTFSPSRQRPLFSALKTHLYNLGYTDFPASGGASDFDIRFVLTNGSFAPASSHLPVF
uniref:Methyltransferase FkbM domain-containing protein n=1 Tax=Aureoumbra lagunensis TaxID=44058 RepID=A0A7S3K3K9_9STRA|mmetsp:Transcript_5388/g.7930  ORF Transcript_5388/g.7930 Transcript_5388/m.7930 type:complete len:341 (+) Transcript_5388:2-1024(+)